MKKTLVIHWFQILSIKKRISSLIKEINFTRIQGKIRNAKCQSNSKIQWKLVDSDKIDAPSTHIHDRQSN
jgi:hypothetical protein